MACNLRLCHEDVNNFRMLNGRGYIFRWENQLPRWTQLILLQYHGFDVNSPAPRSFDSFSTHRCLTFCARTYLSTLNVNSDIFAIFDDAFTANHVATRRLLRDRRRLLTGLRMFRAGSRAARRWRWRSTCRAGRRDGRSCVCRGSRSPLRTRCTPPASCTGCMCPPRTRAARSNRSDCSTLERYRRR